MTTPVERLALWLLNRDRIRSRNLPIQFNEVPPGGLFGYIDEATTALKEADRAETPIESRIRTVQSAAHRVEVVLELLFERVNELASDFGLASLVTDPEVAPPPPPPLPARPDLPDQPAPQMPTLEDDDELVDIDTAAEILRVSKGTLAIWRMKGTGPAFVKSRGRGNRLSYSLASIREFMRPKLQTQSTKQRRDANKNEPFE